MTDGRDSTVVRQFRTLFEAGTVAGLTDGQLLERFLDRQGRGAEVAFEALVARHGPMVLGVCRRALADPDDAADAFQATFLILVKKAHSVRVDDSLGRWLYGVSRKVAERARVVAARQPRGETSRLDSFVAPSGDPDRFELRELLDEELSRLPDAFRSAIVLCDLGGLTHEDAGRDLRCPVGTIKSRLARARKKLRERLERRGLNPSTLTLAPSVPASLAESTGRVSWLLAVSSPSTAGVVPASSAILAQEVLKSMTGFKLKLAAAAVLSLGAAATGAGLLAQGRDGAAGRPAVAKKVPEAVDEIAVIEPPRIYIVEVVDGRITLDGDPVDLSGLQKRLWPTEARTGAGPRVVVRLSEDEKYNEVKRVIDAIEACEITKIAFETAKPEPRDKSVATLQEALVTWSKRLAKAQRVANDPADPAIMRAVGEVEQIKTQIDQLNKRGLSVRAVAPRAGVGEPLVNPYLSGKPGRGPVVGPPREGMKVSMPEYVVEPPDIIEVEVLEALPGRPIKGERLVRPDGTISLGFYGEIDVASLTLKQIKEKVVLHLRDFLDDKVLGLTKVDPATGREDRVAPVRTNRVFVDVKSYNSKVYYVLGDVGVPGRLHITGNETVLDGINYAGGLIPSTASSKIRLVRPNPSGTKGEITFDVDLPAIINRGDTSTNYQLFPGDRLIVERSRIVGSNPEPEAAPLPDPRPGPTNPPDVEARLQALERKLDEVLKAVGRPIQP